VLQVRDLRMQSWSAAQLHVGVVSGQGMHASRDKRWWLWNDMVLRLKRFFGETGLESCSIIGLPVWPVVESGRVVVATIVRYSLRQEVRVPSV